MNCLSDREIQEYIDNEYSTRQFAEQHLQQCSACSHKEQKKRQFLDLVINEYNHLYTYSNIPEFKIPQTTFSGYKKIRTRILLFTATAAAAIIFFLMIAPQKPERQTDFLMFYELEMEIDANKPFHDQNLNIVIYSNSEEQLFR